MKLIDHDETPCYALSGIAKRIGLSNAGVQYLLKSGQMPPHDFVLKTGKDEIKAWSEDTIILWEVKRRRKIRATHTDRLDL